MKHIPILYEDEDCLILNKPAGLSVQGGAGVGASLDRLLAAAFSPPPLLVHRLDKDTSGVILVAKHREAAARFCALFSRRGAVKRYLAVCAGRPDPPSGLIRAPLPGKGGERTAETAYTLREAGERFSLLELELGTGRTHQIRRHLAGLAHPILGDDKYGDFALNRELRKDRGLRRLLLHSSRLILPSQEDAPPLDVGAPLPDYFRLAGYGGGMGDG